MKRPREPLRGKPNGHELCRVHNRENRLHFDGWRDVIEVTKPGDEFDSYEMGDLHVCLMVPIPVRPFYFYLRLKNRIGLLWWRLWRDWQEFKEDFRMRGEE